MALSLSELGCKSGGLIRIDVLILHGFFQLFFTILRLGIDLLSKLRCDLRSHSFCKLVVKAERHHQVDIGCVEIAVLRDLLRLSLRVVRFSDGSVCGISIIRLIFVGHHVVGFGVLLIGIFRGIVILGHIVVARVGILIVIVGISRIGDILRSFALVKGVAAVDVRIFIVLCKHRIIHRHVGVGIFCRIVI